MFDTRYSQLSREDLSNLFHSSKWNELTPDQRLDACQEAHNRYADEHHMQRCEVTKADMRGTYGTYNRDSHSITLSESVLKDGEITEKDGTRTACKGSNAEMVNTVFHETSHAYDHQLSNAVAAQQKGEEYNEELIADAEANGVDIDLSRANDSIYIRSAVDKDLYNIQDCEKRANETGNKETAKVFDSATAKLGEDASYKAYNSNLEERDSYAKSLSSARTRYNDENIDRTLNEQTKSLYYNDKSQQDASGTHQSRTAVQAALSRTQGGKQAALNNVRGNSHQHYQASASAKNEGAAENNAGMRSGLPGNSREAATANDNTGLHAGLTGGSAAAPGGNSAVSSGNSGSSGTSSDDSSAQSGNGSGTHGSHGVHGSHEGSGNRGGASDASAHGGGAAAGLSGGAEAGDSDSSNDEDSDSL